MNRLLKNDMRPFVCVPHMRGDEPYYNGRCVDGECVFPTCVGMNREWLNLNYPNQGVPHMRGDEPVYTHGLWEINACSPHAWG